MKPPQQKLSILVASCDKYADIWKPFSLLFKRYWADCPYEIVLITESEVPELGEYVFDRSVACGKGMGWADRLTHGLEQVHTPYVIMLCDDYFLCDRVDTTRMEHLLALAQKHQAGNLRMIQNPMHQRVFSEAEGLGEYDKGTAYCISTMAGIWDVCFLKKLAKGYKSIWEFERHGSFQCTHLPYPILGTREIAFPFEDAVHKGKWEEAGIRLCSRNGIEIDFKKRGQMTHLDIIWKNLLGAILQLNPTRIVKIQNALGLGKK